MNEEAIQDSYDVFVSQGYRKSIDEFKKLISTNPEALNDSYEAFVIQGYRKSIDEYKSLMGVSQSKKKVSSELPKQQVPRVATTALPSADGSLATPRTKKKVQPKEEEGYLDILGTSIMSGINDVNKMITSIPETVYNAFSIPQNAIAYATGWDISTNSEKFKKNFGVENPALKYYKEEGKKLEKEISEFNKDRYKSSSVYQNITDGNYQDAFELLGTGIARSAPTSIALMAGGAALGTGELAAVSTAGFYNENLEQQQEENPDASDIENNIKALGMSAAESVFSSIGEGQIGAVYRDIIKREGAEAGKQVFKDGLVQMYKGALEKYGVPVGLLGEGIEESATQITQNMISGKPAFEGAADAFILGGGSGAMFTAPISLKNAKDRIKNKIVEIDDKKKINTMLEGSEETFSKVFDVPKDSEINEKQLSIASLSKSRDLLVKDLSNSVKNGDITQDQAKQSLYIFDKTKQITGQLRDIDIDGESKVKVANLLKERESLSQKISGKDEALSVLEKQRIAEINEEIKQTILNSKQDTIQKQATEEVVGEIETPEQAQKRIDRIADIETTISNDDATFALFGKRPLLAEARTELQKELETLRAEQDAIQEQATDESVLRTEQPELGLQEMGQGDAQGEVVTEQATQEVTPSQTITPDEISQPIELSVPSATTTQPEEVKGTFLDNILDKIYEYADPITGDKLKGNVFFDGQEVVFTDGNKEFSLGTVQDALSNNSLNATEVTPTFNISEDGTIDILQETEGIPKGKITPQGAGLKAIKTDKNGNVKRVVITDANGVTHSVKGELANELADFMMLDLAKKGGLIRKINSDETTRETFNRGVREASAKRKSKDTQTGVQRLDGGRRVEEAPTPETVAEVITETTPVVEAPVVEEVTPVIEPTPVVETEVAEGGGTKEIVKTKSELFFDDADVLFPNDDIRGGYAVTDENGTQIGRVKMSEFDDDVVKIDEVVSEKRGEGTGNGSAIMKMVINNADKNNTILTLTPNLIGDMKVKGFDTPEKLRTFYEKFGFVKDKGKATMTRQPVKVQAKAETAPVVETESILEEAPVAKPVQTKSEQIISQIDKAIQALFDKNGPDIETWATGPDNSNLIALKRAKKALQTDNKTFKTFLNTPMGKRYSEMAAKFGAPVVETPKVEAPKVEAKVTPKAKPIEKTKSDTEIGADLLDSMTEDERDTFIDDWYEDRIPRESIPGGNKAILLYEARKIAPKQEGKIKRVTIDNSFYLSNEAGFVIRVDGEVYGLTKYENPDATSDKEDSYGDPKDFVWAYTDLKTGETTETFESDADGLIKEIRSKNKPINTAEVESPKSNPKLDKKIEEAEKDVQFYSFKVEDIQEEISIEQNNTKEEIADLKQKIEEVKKDTSLSREQKKEAIEDLKYEIENTKENQEDVINDLKDDLKEAKSDLKKSEKKLEKLKASSELSAIEENKIKEDIEASKKRLKNAWDKYKNMGIAFDPKSNLARDRELVKSLVLYAYNNVRLGSYEASKLIKDLAEQGFEITRDGANFIMEKAFKKVQREVNKTAGVKPKPTEQKRINKAYAVGIATQRVVTDAVKADVKDLKGQVVDVFRAGIEAVKIAQATAKEKAKNIKEISQQLVKDIKELESTGKITPNQALNMISKFNKVNMLNEVSVSNFVDYMTKVFADADYDNKINVAKGRLKNAKKNIATKIGIADGLVGPLQKLFSINPEFIPESYLERYLELVDMFGERKAVLTLEERTKLTDDVNNILDEINNERSAIDELSERFNYSENKVIKDDKLDYAATIKNMLKEGEITQEEADLMNKYKREIVPKVEKSSLSEEELQQEKDDLLEEVKKSNINADELPTRSERDAAKKLASLIKSPAVKELTNVQLKNLLKVIDNINNGYFPHYAHLITEEINSTNNSKVLKSSVNKARLLPLSKIYAKVKSLVTRKDYVLEMIRRNPLFNIDQVIGDFKTKDVFNSILGKAAEAEAKFTSELKAIQSKLSIAEEKIAKSFKLDANKTVMSKFKIMTYMVQLEYNSNQGSKQVNPAAEYLKSTIKHIDEGKSQFKDRDADMLQEILDNYTDEDGNIDIKELYNSFNSAEKSAIKTVQEVNQSLKEKAEYTASVIRGQRIYPLNNYIHLNILSDSKPNDLASGQAFADQYNNSLKPSTKAKSLIERTGKVAPLNFDVFASAQRGAKFVLMDYHLTEPIRTARKTINKTIASLGRIDKEKRRIINAISNSLEESIENLVNNSYTETSVGDDVFDYLKKQGYRSVLAGTGRFAAEFLSNAGFVIFNDPITFSEGLKYTSTFMSTDAPSIMNNVNSKEINRIFPSDTLSGRMIDTNILNEANGIKGSKGKNKIINKVQQLWNLTGKKYTNAVELTADMLITTPDKAIMRPLWFGAFASNFKNETGQDVDFKKIAANDESYMNQYKEAIEKAKNAADEKSVITGASNNAFTGILKGTSKPNQSNFTKGFNNFNNYMSRFLIYEYTSARTGIMAAIGNGSLNKRQGVALLGGVVTRMTVYSLLSKALGSGIIGLLFGDDEDEEEQQKSLDKSIGQALTSTFTSLLFNRDFGNATKMVINKGLEIFNEEYLDALREGDYDPYKDAIQYTAVPIDKKGKQTGIYDYIENVSGAYGPAIKTTNLIIKTYSEEDKKEASAIKRQQDIKNIRIPLEVFGNAGFIPLYKEIRKEVMNEIYKDLKKPDSASEKKKELEKKQIQDEKIKALQEVINKSNDIDVKSSAMEMINEMKETDPDKLMEIEERKKEMKEMKESLLIDPRTGIEYDNPSELKKYNEPLWEKNFGERSEWYKENQGEVEAKSLMNKIRKGEEEEEYNYTPKKKRKGRFGMDRYRR